MSNPVVHFEILGKDTKQIADFYAGIFGWNIDTNNEFNYGMVAAPDGHGIPGGVGASQDGKSLVTVYIEVDDPDAYLKKVEAAGGKTVMPTTDIGMVVLAQFTDPDGNLVGLVKSQPQQ